jgi:hypothetical protein
VKVVACRFYCAAIFVTLTLIACTPTARPPLPEPPNAPADFPFGVYRQAESQGFPVYRIDPDASEAVVFVSRTGPLARFGHDHVVASHDIIGLAQLTNKRGDLAGTRADLWLPLATLAVDEPQLRAAAGLDSEPSAEDIASTHTNMLKSLEADRYPHLILAVTAITTESLDVNLTLHGRSHRYTVPVMIDIENNTLRVTGTFTVQQSDHGITPFSALGGALSVSNALEIQFSLLAIAP